MKIIGNRSMNHLPLNRMKLKLENQVSKQQTNNLSCFDEVIIVSQ